MEELMNLQNGEVSKEKKSNKDLLQITEDILFDAHADLSEAKTFSVPIGELSSLGSAVSSLVPSLRTITQTSTVDAQGLYKLVNADSGDILKASKNKEFSWGSLKTLDGKSKMAKLKEVGSVTETTETVVPIDPATMMIAVALYTIEKKLDKIVEIEEQILNFLEIEKESKIEADVEILISIIKKYKTSWDNQHFVNSNHKMVSDIQRQARADMISYQKKVNEILKSKQIISTQSKVTAKLNDLQKKFKYYRLSLYTFSLASLVEIMLGENFEEDYISTVKDEIRTLSETYRETFSRCSLYLENMSDSSIDTAILKGVGKAGSMAGKIIESIPVVSKGPVDEFLQETGSRLNESAKVIEKKSVREFAKISNPGTGLLIEQMDYLVQIFNHTSQICFDNKNIYLIEN